MAHQDEPEHEHGPEGDREEEQLRKLQEAQRPICPIWNTWDGCKAGAKCKLAHVSLPDLMLRDLDIRDLDILTFWVLRYILIPDTRYLTPDIRLGR